MTTMMMGVEKSSHDHYNVQEETYHKKSPSKKYKRCNEAIIMTNNMLPPLNNDIVVKQQRDSSGDDGIANDTADKLLAMLIAVSFLLKV